MSIPGIASTFTERLAFAMRRAGFDQPRLAKAADTSQQVISQWLSGEGPLPAGKSMLRLPAALQVSGHWLLTGEGAVEPPALKPTEAQQAAVRTALVAVRTAVLEVLDEFLTTSIEPGEHPVAAAARKVAEDVLAYQASPRQRRGRRRKAGGQ